MIRKLLFILFLYALLVWLIVFYLYYLNTNDTQKMMSVGLLWTAGGVAALLLWLVLERVISWLRMRQAQRPVASSGPAVSQKPVHEDDAALLNLFREADQRLAQAPGMDPVRALDLPLYLIVGPEGAGKTAVVQNSGVEPSLLAGQAVGGGGAVSPTRVANLWLLQQSLFVEVSGRVFAGDPSRLAEFLGCLQPGATQAKWKSLWQPAPPPIPLRAVLLFFDARDFLKAPEPSKLDRAAQQIRERLSSIASVLGAEFPVYVLFTKIDALEYYGEFFGRLPEGEVGQVLGVLDGEGPQGRSEDRAWAEAATRRLNALFNSLFLRLSERRLLALTQELDPLRKPDVYEFPREFKRMRTPLVQFLVDVFKPDPLKVGPRLRGFFFTGLGKAERAGGAVDPGNATAFFPLGGAAGATQIFRPDVTTMFSRVAPRSGSGALVDRWMFVKDFFQKVLTSDRPPVRTIAPQSKLEPYRQIAIGAAACIILLLGLVWTVSWVGNWNLESSVKTAIDKARRGPATLTSANLQALDQLRARLVELDNGNSISLHWGLYTGDALRTKARGVYFERLKRLSLDRINQTLAMRLSQSGTNSQEGTGPVYDRLKTHRTIAALGCPVDHTLIPKVLKDSVSDAHPGLADDQVALLNMQLEYYASELGKREELPVSLPEDQNAEAKARAYLRQAGGLEQQFRGLVSKVKQQVKPISVADSVQDYRSVLTGQPEFPGEFTKNGIQLFESEVEKGNFDSGEKCVMGDSGGLTQKAADLQVKDQLRSRYYRQYANAWRDFVGSYGVIHFADTADGARRMNILAGSNSPLLGIVRLVAVNTNFPPPKSGEPTLLEKAAKQVGIDSAQVKAKGQKALDQARQYLPDDTIPMTSADVARIFQPVLFTTPPEQDRLVNDNDGDYVKGLRGLQQSLDALVHASAAEQATAIPQARAAAAQASAGLAGLADKFTDSGNQGLKRQLSILLEQPIQWAKNVIPSAPVPGKNKNAELAKFCREMAPILSKYPFSASSPVDVSMVEVSKGFAPKEGLVWRYASDSDLVARTPQGWQPKPDLQGLKIVPELLAFLDRSQQFTGALFADSGMLQPKLKYVLRPVPGQNIAIKIELDGDVFDSHNPLQKTFYWPAPAGKNPGANGTLEAAGGFSTGFGRFDGVWGVFHLFQNADERPFGTKTVQWSEIRGKGGAAPQKLSPPVKVELVEFPGAVDLFNPKFFEALQCPARAVATN